MIVDKEIMDLKRQLLNPNISTTEFQRIQVEIGKLKSQEMEVHPVPETETEVMELGEIDLKNENEVFQEDLSAKTEVLSPGEMDLQSEKEVLEEAVSHSGTQIINNRKRAERMGEYKKELEDELNPLSVRADEMMKKEEEQAELKHVDPRTLYELNSTLSDRITKLKRQIAGYEKRIKECLEYPNWV